MIDETRSAQSGEMAYRRKIARSLAARFCPSCQQASGVIGLGESLESMGACASPTAATAPIRRISRIEYNNAVNALFNPMYNVGPLTEIMT